MEENMIDGAYIPKAYRALLMLPKQPHLKERPFPNNLEKKKN